MKVLAIGEPLFEFSEMSSSNQDTFYKQGYGGDTSNFSIAVARQGVEVGYQTRIGNDTFGKKFLELWNKEGVSTELVVKDASSHTGLYFISYSEGGHEFTYHRKGSAASLLKPDDIQEKAIKELKYLHVSGITQAISDSSCDAVFKAIELAKLHNVPISYDPNIRLKLWSLERAKAVVLHTAKLATIFMPSLEEAQWLSGKMEPVEIIEYFQEHDIQNIVLKVGANGVYVAEHQEEIKRIPGISVNVVDATGAGDTFDGAFIARLVEGDSVVKAARYANIAAALSTQGYGAVESIPHSNEVKSELSKY